MPLFWFCVAAILEIVGCFSIWRWLRDGRSPGWILVAVITLLGFAIALTRTPTPYAGRAFAAYAGVYLVGSLLWLAFVDHVRLDRWDLLGASLALAGAALILYGPRGHSGLVP